MDIFHRDNSSPNRTSAGRAWRRCSKTNRVNKIPKILRGKGADEDKEPRGKTDRRLIRHVFLKSLASRESVVLPVPPERVYAKDECRLCDFTNFVKSLSPDFLNLTSCFRFALTAGPRIRVHMLWVAELICVASSAKGDQQQGCAPEWLPDEMRERSCYHCAESHGLCVGIVEALFNMYYYGLRFRIDRDYKADKVRILFRNDYSIEVVSGLATVWPVEWTVGAPIGAIIQSPNSQKPVEIRSRRETNIYLRRYKRLVVVEMLGIGGEIICKLIVDWLQPIFEDFHDLSLLLSMNP